MTTDRLAVIVAQIETAEAIRDAIRGLTDLVRQMIDEHQEPTAPTLEAIDRTRAALRQATQALEQMATHT